MAALSHPFKSFNGLLTAFRTSPEYNGNLGRGTSISSTQDLIDSLGFTACSLKCGGITIPPGSKQFSVSGQWELLAVRKKYAAEGSDEFEETPIKVTGDFSVENSLN